VGQPSQVAGIENEQWPVSEYHIFVTAIAVKMDVNSGDDWLQMIL
jgi:hypothetical protein